MRSTSFDLYQDIAFGFRLAAPPSSQPSRAIPDGRSDLSLPDAVSEEIANAMLRGAMLELSGGIDSRLILAAGLARGVRPRAAFTIDTGAADLETARRIARLVEVPHVEIRVEFPGARDARVDPRNGGHGSGEWLSCERDSGRLASTRLQGTRRDASGADLGGGW